MTWNFYDSHHRKWLKALSKKKHKNKITKNKKVHCFYFFNIFRIYEWN